MNRIIVNDFIINVLFPLIVGVIIYFVSTQKLVPDLIKNFFPDGLWSYAFISTMLIMWDRNINFIWIPLAFVLFFFIELLQYFHTINGTGDVLDILTYLIFGFVALLLNRYFKINLNYI